MAGGQKVKKGLPKRCSSAHAKAHRAEMWTAQRKRKAARADASKAAHRTNVALMAAGTPTPWQAARLARAVRRAQQH